MNETHNKLWREWYESWKSRPIPKIDYEEWLEARIEALEKSLLIESLKRRVDNAGMQFVVGRITPKQYDLIIDDVNEQVTALAQEKPT